MPTRVYPVIRPSDYTPSRPISFVIVRFSDEYVHNIALSQCIYSPINEVIVVDNTFNLFFDNLSSALSHGINQAKHDLIAVVHEDVLLTNGWQLKFEKSLNSLEQTDQSWGMLGSVGWIKEGQEIGHWSDPHQFKNYFSRRGLRSIFKRNPYVEVSRLDEQLLVFHKSRLPVFDTSLPSIHYLGEDLAAQLKKNGQKCYVVDAPTIHKYADAEGNLIRFPDQSKKIKDRSSLTYQADYSCCTDYLRHKYDSPPIQTQAVKNSVDLSADRIRQLESPVILIAKGGGGSRLLSHMAQDAGIFLGSELNDSGDSMNVAVPIYKMIIEKYRCHAQWQKKLTSSKFRMICAEMLVDTSPEQPWGFKLPETVFVLTEIASVFPHARYVYLKRDPLTTCLRRTHMTARLDNHIGRITLPMAYEHLGLPRENILKDGPADHMACSTIHQLNLVLDHLASLDKSRQITISFEDLVKDPIVELTRLLAWLNITRVSETLESLVDKHRAYNPSELYPRETRLRIKEHLRVIRQKTGYL